MQQQQPQQPNVCADLLGVQIFQNNPGKTIIPGTLTPSQTTPKRAGPYPFCPCQLNPSMQKPTPEPMHACKQTKPANAHPHTQTHSQKTSREETAAASQNPTMNDRRVKTDFSSVSWQDLQLPNL
jgi:hypothetical protein